ncbi:MAG: hypothetical protein DIU79_15255, partial [Actinobacteria bacterium]
MTAPDLTLTACLRPAALDARRGIVRLHPEVLRALGLKPGDAVRLTGRRTTAGIVARAEPTASRALLYADDLTLGNLAIRDREKGLFLINIPEHRERDRTTSAALLL